MKLPGINTNPANGQFVMYANVFKMIDDKKHYGTINYYKVNRGWRDMVDDDVCLLYTSPSPRDLSTSRMPSSA